MSSASTLAHCRGCGRSFKDEETRHRHSSHRANAACGDVYRKLLEDERKRRFSQVEVTAGDEQEEAYRRNAPSPFPDIDYHPSQSLPNQPSNPNVSRITVVEGAYSAGDVDKDPVADYDEIVDNRADGSDREWETESESEPELDADAPLAPILDQTSSQPTPAPATSSSKLGSVPTHDFDPASGSPVARIFVKEGFADVCDVYEQEPGEIEPEDNRSPTSDESSPYEPWADRAEFHFVEFLEKSGMSQSQIDELLGLEFIQKWKAPPSFKSAKIMRQRIRSQMEKSNVPRFRHATITLRDAPDEPQTFFYLDVMEALDYLWGLEEFEGKMSFGSVKIHDDTDAGGRGEEGRIYGEMNSGRLWEEVEIDLSDLFPGQNITVRAVVLACDATPVTKLSGSKKFLPVYIALGNLCRFIRTKVSGRGWILFAKLPTPKFSKTEFKTTHTNAEQKGMPRLLNRQLQHEILRFILLPLILQSVDGAPAQIPRMVVDSAGRSRKTMSIVLAWIVDLEEHLNLLGLASYSCPKCLARFHQLDAWKTHQHQPCARRTGDSILRTLRELRETHPHASTWQFTKLARAEGFNGVERLFWEGHWGDICRIASLDELHGLFKASKDHIVSWISNTVGAERLDLGLIAQPQRAGLRVFKNGITEVSQFTGREHRDILRHLLCAVADCEKLDVAGRKTLRAFLDFVYKSQYPVQSERTLRLMAKDLATFCINKYVFLRNGARTSKRGNPHFNIPKPHNFDHIEDEIRDHGALDNVSTEISESLHKSQCKEPWSLCNHKAPDIQILDHLSRGVYMRERSFQVAKHETHSPQPYKPPPASSPSTSEASGTITADDEDSETVDARLVGTGQDTPSDAAPHHPPNTHPAHLIRTIFMAKKHHSSLPVITAATKFGSRDLVSALARYFVGGGKRGIPREGAQRFYYELSSLPIWTHHLLIWHRFSIQAARPNSDYRTRRCAVHCEPLPQGSSVSPYFEPVLIKVHPESIGFQQRHMAGDVVFLFRFSSPDCPPTEQGRTFAYVHWYQPISSPEPHTQLRKVTRWYIPGVGPAGGIVPVTDIIASLPLAPVLSDELSRGTITYENSWTKVNEFYINPFIHHLDYEQCL